jgi:3-isopropylmalate/(R)-2-methylmalate dehydratase small subunit/methanogen homoaconitase small subunit
MSQWQHAWKFGDDVNTDVIHAPAFYSLDDDHVKKGLFHGHDPTLQSRLAPGDLLVAGRNFGCGSSRETSIRSLLLNRIAAIVAVDFARIFFRNATNNGLPCLRFACSDDLHRVRDGQRVRLSLAEMVLCGEDGSEIPLEPPGPFVQRLWQVGGLLALLPASGTAPGRGT